MPLQIDGLASGLDTTSIIEGLLEIQNQQVTRLNNRIAGITSKQSAFKGVEAGLLSLRGSLSQLSRIQDNVFEARIATSSDETLVAAAASSGASAGVYSLKVNSIARAHQIASQGFADVDSEITTGTIGIQIGTGAVSTITVDSTNNTLQGLADSINSAGAGVSAAIINDGSTGGASYRLLLTSEKSGTSSGITVINSLADSSGNATRPILSSEAVIGAVQNGIGNTSTGSVTSNSGSGYTGSADDTYTFTITQGGTGGGVLGDDIEVSYSDGSGENTGTLTFTSSEIDSGSFLTVAEGVQIQLGVGTYTQDDTFTVDVVAAKQDVQPASDASITIGSGPGAITVSGDSNQIEDVIPGVTLDLLSADVSKTVTLSVTDDVESARQSIDGFVSAFNSVVETIDSQVRFDAETGQAGVLLGNRSIITIQDEVRNAVLQTVTGISGATNRLSSIGITFDASGQLTVDSSRLDDVLNGRVDDVSLDDVRRLFSFSGESTNAGVQFLGGSIRTKDSASPVAVDISQAAERAVITATSDLAASTVIDSSNNTFTISIDSQTSATLILAEGTYTRQELADHLDSAINGDATLVGREVSVGLNGDALQVTSLAYGTNSKVSDVSGTSASLLGFSGTESDQGQDVVGKFIVDGVSETAIGKGRLLIGESDNENTADLQVRVTLGSAQVQSGTDANLTVTRGLAAKLDLVLNSILDPANGRVKTVNDSFDEQIQDIEETIERQNALVEQRKEALIEQFIALESAISKFQSAGNFLAAQLAGVAGLQS